MPALGISVSPAHIALDARRSVGLPDRVGLLVRHVRAGGRGAAAGLRPGDLRVTAAGHAVRGSIDLEQALTDDAHCLTVVRGVDELELSLDTSPDQLVARAT